MSRWFLLSVWLMLTGLLVGGFGLVQLADGQSVHPASIATALAVSFLGLIGARLRWRAERLAWRGDLRPRTISIELDLSDEAASFLLRKAGAIRPLDRVFDELVKMPIAQDLLSGRAKEGMIARVDLKDEALALSYAKPMGR